MSWKWVALSLLGFFLFGLGYIYGFERGVKGTRDMVRKDCERLGVFYIGKTVFRCLEIKEDKNNG